MVEKIAAHLISLLSIIVDKPFGKEITIFIISLLPILELRGGLIAASLLDVPIPRALIITILGNIIPVFLILTIFEYIYNFLKNSNLGLLKKLALYIDNMVDRRKSGFEKLDFIGLILFVGIPLPGTGAWTGCMLAVLLKMDKKRAFVACSLGILLSSIIMSILSFGLVALLG